MFFIYRDIQRVAAELTLRSSIFKVHYQFSVSHHGATAAAAQIRSVSSSQPSSGCDIYGD